MKLTAHMMPTTLTQAIVIPVIPAADRFPRASSLSGTGYSKLGIKVRFSTLKYVMFIALELEFDKVPLSAMSSITVGCLEGYAVRLLNHKLVNAVGGVEFDTLVIDGSATGGMFVWFWPMPK